MRIAVLSDTRLPTSPDYPGHGLGKINLAIAEGLQARGYDVTLFAGVGSRFDGALNVHAHEADFYADNRLADYDAILDGGHDHGAGRADETLPIVNLSHDRETLPGRNAVYVSDAHRAYWHDPSGRVIYHGIDTSAYPLRRGAGEYLAWLASFHAHKGPLAAMQVSRLANCPLKMAGPDSPNKPHGAPYVGGKTGADKIAFLCGARALLCPFGIESASLVALEAQACGIPAIGFNLGGLPEYIADDVTGFIVDSTAAMVSAVGRLVAIHPEQCREWVVEHRNIDTMIAAYEHALQAVANGEAW